MTAVAAKKKSSAPLTAGKVVGRIVLYAFLIFFLIVALVPFVWMISSSLKTSTDVFTIPMHWIPETFRFENYVDCLLYTSRCV